jgi:hypothetical protein
LSNCYMFSPLPNKQTHHPCPSFRSARSPLQPHSCRSRGSPDIATVGTSKSRTAFRGRKPISGRFFPMHSDSFHRQSCDKIEGDFHLNGRLKTVFPSRLLSFPLIEVRCYICSPLCRMSKPTTPAQAFDPRLEPSSNLTAEVFFLPSQL